MLDGCRLVGGDAPRLQNELTKTRTKISDLAITPPGHFLVQNCVFLSVLIGALSVSQSAGHHSFKFSIVISHCCWCLGGCLQNCLEGA